ncbi:hypothetical protein [Embleya sp. NPDC001921]
MRGLLEEAVRGLGPPSLPGAAGVDEVFREAARIRRRRRRVLASVGTGAAVVAVIGGGTLLPPPADSAGPRGMATNAGASASAHRTPLRNGSDPADGSPGPLDSREASLSPSPVGTDGTPLPATSLPQSTRPPTTASSDAEATFGGGPGTPGAEALVATFLRPEVGAVRKEAFTNTPLYTPNPLSGRYLVSRDGRTGWLDVTVYDPKVNADQRPPTIADEWAHDWCADLGVVAPNTECVNDTLSDGSLLKTWTSPPNQQEPGAGHRSTGGFGASVTRADGRSIEIRVTAGIVGGTTYGPPLAAPPLDQAELSRAVKDSAWFRR